MAKRLQHYSLDAATLIVEAEAEVVDLLHENPKHTALIELLDRLRTTRDYVWGYLDVQIASKEGCTTVPSSTLSEAIGHWSRILAEKKQESNARSPSFRSSMSGGSSIHAGCYFPTKSVHDTMLFRLHVVLQLCLVRTSSLRASHQSKRSTALAKASEICTLAVGAALLAILCHRPRRGFVCTAAGLMVTTAGVRRLGGAWWMARKLRHSAHALAYWNSLWEDHWRYDLVARPRHESRPLHEGDATLEGSSNDVTETTSNHSSPRSVIDLSNPPPVPQRLPRYQVSTLQMSEGEFRFLLLKRFMDVFYASVGAASSIGKAQDWQLHLATAAAAAYYSLTGASTKAIEVTSASRSARELLEKAWGMVSLPTVKNLSLHASRLAKGAAVADRINIGGVSCFILSRDAVPELALVLKQQRRRTGGSKSMIHRLSTIDESKEHTHESTPNLQQKFAKGEYRQRNVILHLTGGGFFAHIIASDLPYLLDWSNATGAVVVCPEYALLPDNKFPAALQDVENVYQNLRDSNIVCTLGFEVNRIILTGESAGGNLAAALCVKLQMDLLTSSPASDDEISLSDIMSDESDTEVDLASVSDDNDSALTQRLPSAMLLSCPVLDLTGGLPPSSASSQFDPVLPTGLVSAISDAYVPKGIRKNISLISPLYATDDILEHFPSTLIFASSNDPVLDDAVVLNQRLNDLGVSSELRAVENLPHAYLGLGTAGFPEAQQVQAQIEEWLIRQLQP